MKLAAARHTGEPELAFVRRLADPSKIAIDVGANWGPYAGELLPHVRQVVVFEPNPVHADDLLRAWPGLRLERVALSDHAGTATLRIPISGTGLRLSGYASVREDHGFAAHEEIEVPIKRLDDYAFTDVGFIKIDIEGHELAAVRGAMDTIVRERPTMLIESVADHAPGCPEALVELLAGVGYSAWFLKDGTFHPFSAWTPALSAGGGDVLINNFVFSPGAELRLR